MITKDCFCSSGYICTNCQPFSETHLLLRKSMRLLEEMYFYLAINNKTNIASGSLFHQNMEELLKSYYENEEWKRENR